MDVSQIRHVAELAELSLSPEEEAKLAEDMSRILAYVAELDALDTSDVPPTTAMSLGAPADVAGAEARQAWRDDVPVPGLSHEDALAGAPRAEHDGFAVPTFVGS